MPSWRGCRRGGEHDGGILAGQPCVKKRENARVGTFSDAGFCSGAGVSQPSTVVRSEIHDFSSRCQENSSALQSKHGTQDGRSVSAPPSERVGELVQFGCIVEGVQLGKTS
jgi:hypothetical protein